MSKSNQTHNTGLSGLDKILQGVRLGDNVVMQVDAIDDYVRFVHPFAKAAHHAKKDLIYFRFADHEPVIPEGIAVHTYELHPEAGFENFISEIFDVIEKLGKGAFYIFDCLSELAVDWYSDRMLGNFFMLTCPYLFDYETVAYFALKRDNHTAYAIEAIHGTAQIVMDVYRHKEDMYVHPLKVEGRYTPTMYMLHRWDKEEFAPVTRSSTTAEILTAAPQPWLDFTMQKRDVWTRNFLQAQEVVNTTRSDSRETWKKSKLFQRLLRMAVTRDERPLKLAEKYFDFADVVDIGKRMIGTGLVGGKSVGMLLARAILKKADPIWAQKLEPHDSFYIGSDVFYTYLIQNKCWWMRRKLNSTSENFDLADEACALILKGEFTKDIQDQFLEMLDYFGQSPIIVRSSSLLEDAYGNSFSGKYESVFCANQGTPEERFEKFVDAVRTVYASTMSKEALSYRAHWGLLDSDEQMALLVQRVSGTVHESQFFPQISGVGFSFNPFVWNSEIDPKAGMLRLVFGLGTRAVERVDDDYTRIVALNAPMRRPEASSEDIRKYTQHKIDILDLKANCHTSRMFEDVIKEAPDVPLDIFASRDQELERRMREMKRSNVFSWILAFDTLLSKTAFVDDMRTMLTILQESYNYPVDVEFTTNFLDKDHYRINLVQCRPFQVKGNILSVETPRVINREKIILETKGPVIGSSVAMTIDRIIYVSPEAYGTMKEGDRYAVARLVGRLTHLKNKDKKPTMMLIGPGRWATSTPSLGVPVSFTEINTASVLCEVAAMHEGLIPEVSLGTHFFNDLVEMDMLYFALYPQKYDNLLNSEFFKKSKNQLTSLIPDAASLASVVYVIDADVSKEDECICLNADVLKQNAVCYLGEGTPASE
ncbi:MAG: PEP/pyruvate-binding domain-containing protein [Candidatus Omnitrophota bacterium]